MVTILTAGPFIVRVYSRDHKPVHCHVIWGDNEVIVELPSYKVEVRSKNPIKVSDINAVRELVKNNRRQIGKQWRVFHGN